MSECSFVDYRSQETEIVLGCFFVHEPGLRSVHIQEGPTRQVWQFFFLVFEHFSLKFGGIGAV